MVPPPLQDSNHGAAATSQALERPPENGYFDSPEFDSDMARFDTMLYEDPHRIADTLQALHQTQSPSRIALSQSLEFQLQVESSKQRILLWVDVLITSNLLVILAGILTQKESYNMDTTCQVPATDPSSVSILP